MDPHGIAAQELLRGERVVWVGRPGRAAFAQPHWPKAGLGLFFTLFALLWLGTALSIPFGRGEGAPLAFVMVFPLIGLVVLGVGLTMLLSPLWYWRKADHVTYAVTDGRVLIIEPGRVQSFEPADIQHLVRRDRGGGRGDLVFREEQANPILAMYTFGLSANRKIGFLGVADIRAAEEAVRQLKRSGS